MNRSKARVLRAAMCCLLVALGVSRAEAGPGPIDEPLRWAPADADAVFVLRNGAAARHTALGLAGEQALLGLLVGAEQTRDAWSAFAETLGYTEPEAFDALLGDRFVIVARGFWSVDTPTEWVVVSDIAPAVDDRLRERIARPPRAVIWGMPVFALEQGRFSLLRDARGGRIVIAPTASMKLLKSIAVGMRKDEGEGALAATPAAARIARLGGGDALGLVRFPEQIGGWWGGVAELGDRTAVARLVTAVEAPMAPPAAWSIEAWRALGRESALLFVEQLMDEDEARPQGLDGVFAKINESLDPVLEAGDAERGALVMLPRAEGGLDVGGAMACRDGLAAAAPVDALMQRVVATLGGLAGAPAPGHDFGGMFPKSERRVAIGEAGGAAPVFGAMPIEMVWRFHPDEASDASGWWVGGSSADAHDRLTRAVGSQAPGERGRWLSYGVARPNLLVERIGSTGLPIPSLVRGFGGVATVEWWSWMEAPTEMLGRVEITAMPDPEGF